MIAAEGNDLLCRVKGDTPNVAKQPLDARGAINDPRIGQPRTGTHI
jgi:hypothetical protein